ncbi:MAG: AbrB family transcriptional regulator [Thermodesulfobacteriota bacterium]
MTSARNIRQWAGLILLSCALAWGFVATAFPAALLLGPMVAAVCFGLAGASIRAPGWTFSAAQAVIGLLVARAVTPSILLTIARDWPVMVLVVSATIAAGAAVGYVLTRRGSLPGNTAAWGCSPGGAAAMTAMAEEFGADVRLVAFMQYLRVFIVVLTASGVSRFLLGAQAAQSPAATFDLGLSAPLVPLVQTLSIAMAGMVIGRALRIPAGAMLLPLVAGAALNSTGTVALTLPPWLLDAAYAFLGWHIGLRFTPDVVRHAFRAIPQLVLATGLLMGLCALSAWMLSALHGSDALTAYLATSPGGLDSIAVIAVGGGADIPFVLALQTFRLFAVVLTGPFIARLLSRMA